MQITQARPADLTQIRELIRALSAFHGDEATVSLEALQEALFNTPLNTAFVARTETALIGYAGITGKVTLHSGRPDFDIQHLFIQDGYRSQGIGKALIAAARAFATARGARHLTIGTDPANKTAQAAYRGMGLEEITDAGPRFRVPEQAGQNGIGFA